MGLGSICTRVQTAANSFEVKAPPLSESNAWGAPERRHAVESPSKATHLASTEANAPASMGREEPSKMMRRHHVTPARAKASFRPSRNQEWWGASAVDGCGWGGG